MNVNLHKIKGPARYATRGGTFLVEGRTADRSDTHVAGDTLDKPPMEEYVEYMSSVMKKGLLLTLFRS